MKFTAAKKFLFDRIWQLILFLHDVAGSLSTEKPTPCTIDDRPSVIINVYSHDGPSAYKSETFYFNENEDAHEWLRLMSLDDFSDNWSHAHISGDIFVAFNNSGATPNAFTFGYSKPIWEICFMDYGTTCWKYVSNDDN